MQKPCRRLDAGTWGCSGLKKVGKTLPNTVVANRLEIMSGLFVRRSRGPETDVLAVLRKVA